MRCVVVNGAKLKAEVKCAHCGSEIDENYVREIGTRAVYCNFRCYSVAVETSTRVFGYRALAPSAWTRTS